MVFSQGGPLSEENFLCVPPSHETRFDSAVFRVLLLRRFHQSACATTGVFGRRGFAVKSAAARICCEGGGRVRTNIKVITDRVAFVRWSAVYSEHDSGVRCARRRHAPQRCESGVVLREARARKERTYFRVAREGGGVAKWGGGGGRWSSEIQDFFSALGKEKARSAPLCCKAKCAARGCADGAEFWRAL